MALDDIRYARLGYITLGVADLGRSTDFYREMVGVGVTESDDKSRTFLNVSDRHHDIELTKGEGPMLRRIGWQMESEKALDAARFHFGGLDIAVTDLSAGESADRHIGRAFRIVEPTTGAVFEFYTDMAPGTVFVPTHTDIMGFGHIVLSSSRKVETEAFLVEHMGFRISDRIGDFVTFMRCFPNPYHHSLGIGAGKTSALGHLNFMVRNYDDIGRANVRMRKNNVPIVYGPGRHPTSGSVFFYFLDPDGITVEYSAGMEEFSERNPRADRMLPPVPESFDTWGGTPHEDFQRAIPIEGAH